MSEHFSDYGLWSLVVSFTGHYGLLTLGVQSAATRYVAHAHALAGAGRAPGRFLVYLGTTPEHRERAERCIREELDRLLQGGVSEQEFDDARSYLRGREAMRRETSAQRADLRAEALFYGEPLHELSWVDARFASLRRNDVEEAAHGERALASALAGQAQALAGGHAELIGELDADQDIAGGEVLGSSRETRRFLQCHLGGQRREVFSCLFLDSQHRW